MRIIVALLALTAFLVGAAPRALAEEGDDASASPPGVTGGPAHGQAPAPGDDSTQLGAPESEAARPEANPDPRDPSEDEAGTENDRPQLGPGAPAVDPYAVDPTNTDPSDADAGLD